MTLELIRETCPFEGTTHYYVVKGKHSASLVCAANEGELDGYVPLTDAEIEQCHKWLEEI